MPPQNQLEIPGLKKALGKGEESIQVKNLTQETAFEVNLDFSPRQREILLAGGLLNLTRAQAKKA